ncbi:N-acetylmuramate alpha-1-phosphate uridylyltransferase MurU [Litoribacillus peritrichatus]|uniref:Nucleotidyltransferase family protein n=1 Tax=Litoribacillus peritrichatus TaxID=718191 RepID=A0ABP7LYH5_9GAMM
MINQPSDSSVYAMILAAGKGTRMRPLTDDCPKPLLKVAGLPLIEHHLRKLKRAGVTHVVVNCAYLAEKVEAYIHQRPDDGLDIYCVNEGQEPLETAGGIVNALPQLGERPFIVVNGDVWTDFDYRLLVQAAEALIVSDRLGELVLVNNPVHNPAGDFAVESSVLRNKSESNDHYTFSGLSVFKPQLFRSLSRDSGALGPMLRSWANQSLLSASVYPGYWLDVGTPERLIALEDRIAGSLVNDET